MYLIWILVIGRENLGLWNWTHILLPRNPFNHDAAVVLA